MDDILSLVIVAVIYLAVAVTGNKKKKKKNAKQRASKRRRAEFDQAFAATEPPKQPSAQAATTMLPEYEDRRPAFGVPCGDRRLHLHEVSQEEMQMAGEGEDPCHGGGAPDDKSPVYEQEIGREKPELLAQDILRGVVMSEILMRPQDRAALNRNRRRG